MKVPLLDLRPPLEELRDEIVEAVTQVIDSTRYIMGPEIDGLESEISAYCGTTDAVGVSSGTDALLLSLMVLDVAPGDLVLTSNFSFFATAGVVARLNATPVFVDCDDTFCINTDLVEERITARTKALLPVHFTGYMTDMRKLIKISEKYELPIVEDACQSILGSIDGRNRGYRCSRPHPHRRSACVCFCWTSYHLRRGDKNRAPDHPSLSHSGTLTSGSHAEPKCAPKLTALHVSLLYFRTSTR